jgi:hypothetical protein
VWTLIRRPLLLLFVIGCTVSFLTASQLTVRLIVDGAVSFAFVPIIQLAALAAVIGKNGGPLPFAHAVDRFFAGSGPWLLTLAVLSAAASISRPIFWSLTLLELALVPAIAASLLIDYRFFREVARRQSPGRAVALQRLIAWPLTLFYFLGIPIWAELLPQIPGWPIR